MLRLFRDQKGFTLVELMIVVVIVGILAAVAIPMYKGATQRAKASEAEAALGSIRSALRVYYAEYREYPADSNAAPYSLSNVTIDSTDLVGKYYRPEDYKYTGGGEAFTVTATGSAARGVAGIDRTIDQDGTITR